MKRKSTKHGTALRCDECGAETSAAGRSFTASSLRLHKQMVHSNAIAEAPIACDICGQSTSRRGLPFNAHKMQLHMAKAHPSHLRKPEAGTALNAKSAPAEQQSDPERARSASSKPTGKRADRVKTARPMAKFCPQCGCNLEVVNAALSFTAGVGL